MKRIGIGRFLVIGLVLCAGTLYGAKLVQQNQENRSKAANESVTNVEISGINVGTTVANSSACKKLGGQCAKFSKVLASGVSCKVLDGVSGTIKTGKCNGNSFIRCCVPINNKVSTTPTPLPISPAPINGICGKLIDTCVQGKNGPFTETGTQYLWDCVGTNGGTAIHCSYNK